MSYDWRQTLQKAVIHGAISAIGILLTALAAYLSDPTALHALSAKVPFLTFVVPPLLQALWAAYNNLRKNYGN